MKIYLSILFLLIPMLAYSQIITTIAGTGVNGYNGDGISATAAELSMPYGIGIDNIGNVLISDIGNNRLRKVDRAGIITTFAGTGLSGQSGDGGPASAAQVAPFRITVDRNGNIYVGGGQCIRKISTSGIITTVAGTGMFGFNGDGIPATSAKLNDPRGLAVDKIGNLYIADYHNSRIRKVDTLGYISTIAGLATPGFSGDGGLAVDAALYMPIDIALDTLGNLYFADYGNHRIRKIDSSGIISTIAGRDSSGYSGDGGAATLAKLKGPTSIALNSHGDLYIGHWGAIRMVNTADIITTISGDGTCGYSGNGGTPDLAKLCAPYGLAIDGSDAIYFVDQSCSCVRRIGFPVSISSLERKGKNVQIYPNPAINELTIKYSDKISTISISNCIGQILSIHQFNSEEVRMDIGDLPNGLYFVTINGIEVRRFVKV